MPHCRSTSSRRRLLRERSSSRSQRTRSGRGSRLSCAGGARCSPAARRRASFERPQSIAGALPVALKLAPSVAWPVAPRSSERQGREKGSSAGRVRRRLSSRNTGFAPAHPGLRLGERRTPSFPDPALPTTTTRAGSGNLGGAAKTWVTDRYGLRVLRGTGWLANLHLLWVVVDVRQVQRARR